jgi:hypothetical protein
MTGDTATVTVYRSADNNAQTDATAVFELLSRSGVEAVLAGPDTPGVVFGTWEVRVPAGQAARAELIVAGVNQEEPGQADPSRDLDMVTLRRTQGATGELEAMSIQSILQANEIPCVVVGNSTLPNFAFFVRVSKIDLERAEAALAEAQAAGPAAAVEAERETEGPNRVS